MQKKKKKQGFTLMEVLVTVLLIAILAGMAMPQYMKVVEKQKGTEAVNLLASIATSQERYFAVNEAYTTDFSDLDADLVDFNTRTAAEGSTYYTKYFYFQLQGDKDNTSKVVATRRGNESYVLERNYTTGDVCCKNDNTSDGDICDVLDIPNDTCAEGEAGNTGGGTTPPVTPTCSGSEPASSQTCASGCGTQTRSVTCSSGTWVTGSWTGTCTSPTQTLPTSQSCGSGGTQTRTCTATCGGGTCGSWSTCSGQGCTSTQPSTTQTCTSGCGTQTRSVTCSNGTWVTGSWTGTCTSPTQTQPTSQSCGSGGTQTRTCIPTCDGGTCMVWSNCTGQTCPSSTKPAESQVCGKCGTQTRTVGCDSNTGTWTTGSWGTCSGEGICAPGATQTCNSTGTQTCSSSCTWESCSVIPCSESSKPVESQSCGNCSTGTQTRSVTCNTANGTWTTGSWGTCSGGGTCAPGATQSCGSGGNQVCSSSCTWGSCSCNTDTRPISARDCDSCGRQTRTVSCSNGTWITGSWGACTGYYVMLTDCCDGNSFITPCKAGGSWNYLPACGYYFDPDNPDCKDSFVKSDPHPRD